MKESFYRIDCLRILELMGLIEERHQKCFHELYPDLDDACRRALDGETHASFVINQLCKILDDVNYV